MRPKMFTVWEHNALRVGDRNDKQQFFTATDLQSLIEYRGSGKQGIPYFSLGYNCAWFSEYVGVLQVGHLTIEILPKIDNADSSEWRDRLIEILHKVHRFDVSITGTSDLTLKSNSILEYYFKLFLNETRKLLHQGLVKRYRSIEANSTALKGKLLVSKHLTYNSVHQQRFFIKRTTYDRQNIFNQLLYKTLQLIQAINNNMTINSDVGALLLDFPEMTDVKATEETFVRLMYDRKTEAYKTAIDIARLLLLRYHPDLQQGKQNVLALMFDMNLLWEKFVFVTLCKYLKDYNVQEQTPKPYWKMEGYRSVSLRPDIKLNKDNKNYIIDTKWKLIENKKPSSQDLQQMFAYTKYFSSSHTVLLYPGTHNSLRKGFFHHELLNENTYPCSIGTIALSGKELIKDWQMKIANQVRKYILSHESIS